MKAASVINLKELSSCHKCGHKDHNIICSVSSDVLSLLDAAKIKSTYKPHQTIFYQGNDPLGLYTVSEGLVKLESVSESGQAHTVRYVGAGHAIGYQSLFTNEKYNVSATTVENSIVCFIPKNVVMDIFNKFPMASFQIMKALSEDLKLADSKWTDQMDKDVPQRVAEAILYLQDHFAHQNWTRKEIAEWAGTTPESVIRTLAQFEKSGFIDQTEGRNIKILNRSGLMNK